MIRNRYDQVPYLNWKTIWESDENAGKHPHKRAKRSALSYQATTRLKGTDKKVIH